MLKHWEKKIEKNIKESSMFTDTMLI